MVEKPPTPPLPLKPKTRNARTRAIHRREAIWQIAIPFGIMAIVALTLMAVMAFAPQVATTRSPLADVSVIFLVIPTAIWGVVLLAVIIGICVGLFYALRELPYLFKQVQDFTWLTAQETKRYTGYVAQGVVSLEAFLAAVQKTLNDIRSIFTFGRRA